MSRGDGSHIVLVGLMATGKTTVSALVADELGWPRLDSDDQVEQATGRTVREIWRTDGEPAFRALEEAAMGAALAAETPSVIAAAGGVVLSEQTRLRLRRDDATVVWLRARPETLLARVLAADDAHRPLLDDDPGATLARMARDRSALYEEVADVVIDVDDAEPIEVARTIVAVYCAPHPGEPS